MSPARTSAVPCLTQEEALAEAPRGRRGPIRRPADPGGEPVTRRGRPIRRRDAGRQDRRQGAVVHRGHPGLPGPDRGNRRPVPRLSARRGRRGVVRGGRRRQGAGRRGSAAVGAGRGAAGAQGRVHHHRHADHLRVQDPRGLAFAVRRHASPRDCARPASRYWARPTWTSSRWARRPRTPPTAPPATRGTSTGCPAAPAAAARRRWPRSRRRWPSDPTPAARSASRPR